MAGRSLRMNEINMKNIKRNFRASLTISLWLVLSLTFGPTQVQGQVDIDIDHVATDLSLGRVTVSVSGDALPLTIILIDQMGTERSDVISHERGYVIFDDLSAGTYTLRVLDRLSCISDQTIVIEERSFVCEDMVAAITEISHVSVCGDQSCIDGEYAHGCAADGFIQIEIQSDFGYDLRWSGPHGFVSSRSTLSLLSPGTYMYTVTSSVDESCQITGEVILTYCDRVRDGSGGKNNENDCTTYPVAWPLRLDIDDFDIIWSQTTGSCDGSVDVNVSDVNGVLRYYWESAEGQLYDQDDIGALCPGDYVFHLSNGCDAPQSWPITIGSCSDTPIYLEDYTLVHTCVPTASGVDMAYGSIEVSDSDITGGHGPYDFTWSDGQSGNRITDLRAGVYTLTIRDAFGCTAEYGFEIRASRPLSQELIGDQCREYYVCNDIVTSEIAVDYGCSERFVGGSYFFADIICNNNEQTLVSSNVSRIASIRPDARGNFDINSCNGAQSEVLTEEKTVCFDQTDNGDNFLYTVTYRHGTLFDPVLGFIDLYYIVSIQNNMSIGSCISNSDCCKVTIDRCDSPPTTSEYDYVNGNCPIGNYPFPFSYGVLFYGNTNGDILELNSFSDRVNISELENNIHNISEIIGNCATTCSLPYSPDRACDADLDSDGDGIDDCQDTYPLNPCLPNPDVGCPNSLQCYVDLYGSGECTLVEIFLESSSGETQIGEMYIVGTRTDCDQPYGDCGYDALIREYSTEYNRAKPCSECITQCTADAGGDGTCDVVTYIHDDQQILSVALNESTEGLAVCTNEILAIIDGIECVGNQSSCRLVGFCTDDLIVTYDVVTGEVSFVNLSGEYATDITNPCSGEVYRYVTAMECELFGSSSISNSSANVSRESTEKK